MRSVYGGLLVIFWTATSGAVLAQSQQARQPLVDPVGGTTVEQAVATALENLASLRAARAAVAAAEARRAQAALRPNPILAAGWRQEIGGMGRMNETSVTLPLDLFRRGPRTALAEAGIEVAEAEARRALLVSELEVRRQYGALLAAIRRVEVARELETAAGRIHELLAARAEAGAAPPLDRDLARVEFERMSARARAAAADAEAAAIDLRRAMGLNTGDMPRVRLSLEAVFAQPQIAAPAGEQPAGIIETRPDVQAASARIRARDAAIEQARSEGTWDLSVSAGYARMHSGFPFSAFDEGGLLRGIEATFHNVTFGAMVMVPLFDRNQGAVAEAAAEHSAAEAEAEDVRLAATAEVSRTSIQLRAALDVAGRYRTTIVPQAVQNVETVIARYELGRGTLFDVLQARQQLLQIQDEYTDALFRAYEAHVAAIGARGGVNR